MPKRALTEGSGHRVEKKRSKRRHALALHDADGMDPSVANVEKNGSMKKKNAIPGGILAMQNNISSESAAQSHLNEGSSIKAEVVGRHMSDEKIKKAVRKEKQAPVSEKMNCTKQENDCSLSSVISIEINPKVILSNFKGELSLPPSPITGVIDCLVDKPSPHNNHLDLLKEGEIAFSFHQPNITFSKEIPLDDVPLGTHGDKATRRKERTVAEDDLPLKIKKKKEKEVTSVPSEKSITPRPRKKLLVLDLNGLLCDIVNDYSSGKKAEKKIGGKPIFKRPFCDDFLKFCFDNFHMGIWSSRRKYNVDTAVDYLLGEFKHKLLFCWDQSKCTYTGSRTIENYHKPLVLKELKKIWNQEEADLSWKKGKFSSSNTLLIDDSPYKALRNPPHTAIFPYPYHYSDTEDNSLGPEGDIRLYIEQLLISDDVQRYVEEHPFGQSAITDSDQHWNFYCQIISTDATTLS